MARRSPRRMNRSVGVTLRTADLLLVLSVLTLVFTALYIGLGIHERTSAGETFTAEMLFSNLGALAAGLALAAIFLALSWTLRTLDGLSRTLERFRNTMGGAVGAAQSQGQTSRRGATSAVTADSVRQVRELLEEIRDHTLLNEEQKQARWARLLERRKNDLSESVQDLIEQKRFGDAIHEIDSFEERYGRDEEVTALRRKLDSSRRLSERRDLTEALDAYVTLKANHEWDRALRLAEDLLSTYPQSIEIREWMTQIGRDRDQATAVARRAELMDEVQRFTSDREWRKALASARMLLDEYTDSAEAMAVRPELGTLEHNAEVETRQELEAQIKELIKFRRFSEALKLAQDVIEQYPDSPQAEALRGQLPRLRERAAGQAR